MNNRCKFKIQHGPRKKKVLSKGFTGNKEIRAPHKTPTIESTATAELVNCDQRRHPKKRRNLLKWVHVETQNQQGHLNVTPGAYSTVSSKPRNTFNYTQLSQVQVGNEASSTTPRHRTLRKRRRGRRSRRAKRPPPLSHVQHMDSGGTDKGIEGYRTYCEMQGARTRSKSATKQRERRRRKATGINTTQRGGRARNSKCFQVSKIA